MTVVLLDPRFPSMIPVDAVTLLSGKVSYTEEVPIRIRWVIGDLGGHTVYESDVLVTCDLRNDLVIERIEEATAADHPSLLVHLPRSGDRAAGLRRAGAHARAAVRGASARRCLEWGSRTGGGAGVLSAVRRAVDDAYQQSAHLYYQPSAQQRDEDYAADAVARLPIAARGSSRARFFRRRARLRWRAVAAPRAPRCLNLSWTRSRRRGADGSRTAPGQWSSP